VIATKTDATSVKIFKTMLEALPGVVVVPGDGGVLRETPGVDSSEV
jgi:hypothetical protein